MQQHHASPQRVLVAYATRGGSTRELAEQVAQVLERSGVSLDLQPVAAVRTWPRIVRSCLGARSTSSS